MTFSDLFKNNSVEARADYDIFISYSRRDKDFVRQLWEHLTQADFKVWVDWEDIPPAEDWRQEIYRGIESAHNFLFVVSHHSTNSSVCGEELFHAISHNKRLFSVLIQEIEFQSWHSSLANSHQINCQTIEDLNREIKKLIKALKIDFHYIKHHTHLLIRAKEWEQKQYNSDFLLLGKNLEEAERWLRDSHQKQPQATLLQKNYIETSRTIQTEREVIKLKLQRMTPQQLRNRKTLLNKVRNYWIKGVLETSLIEDKLITLEIEDYNHSSTNNLNTTFQSNSITAIFDQLEKNKNLLILGDSGSGKTTTLLQLARDLINRYDQGINDRIPVIFNLSSWSIKKPKFISWLVEELNIKYQVPKKIAKTWLEEKQLLLLLDGLDEVAIKDREQCLNFLNQFHQNYSCKIVLCSRLQAYENLANCFNCQKAIYLKSLTLKKVLKYCDDAEKFKDLKSLIETDKILQELVSSPLILNITILAYQGITRNDLRLTNLIEERRQQLFNTYIKQMFKRRENQQNYPKEKVIAWLHWLANQMKKSSQTVFLIEGIQPSWLPQQTPKWLYPFLLRMIVIGLWGSVHVCLLTGHQGYQIDFNFEQNFLGFLYGLLGSFLYALLSLIINRSQNHIVSRVINSILLGIIYGFIFSLIYHDFIHGIAYGIIYGIIGLVSYKLLYNQTIELVESFKWSWKKIKNNLWMGLVIGFALYWGTSNQIIPSLIFGIILSFIFGFDKDNEVDQKNIPNQGIWKSLQNSAKLFITIAILTGLLLGLFQIKSIFLDSEFIVDSNFLLVNIFLFGLAGALLGGQGSGIICIKHFILRIILWKQGYIPWNYARFLDDAVKSIFLKKVGNSYVFIHRYLLEYFAQIN